MGISKKEREAYEKGKKEAAYRRKHPIEYQISGGVESMPSDESEAEAFRKGLTGKQLDKD